MPLSIKVDERKNNNMIQSRIKIDLDGHRRPCISVFKSKNTDEAVDKLLSMFIEDLRHESTTLTIMFDGVSESGSNATILPVNNELAYFRSRIINLLHKAPKETGDAYSKNADFFDYLAELFNVESSGQCSSEGSYIAGVSQ